MIIRVLTGMTLVDHVNDLRNTYRVWKLGRYEVIAVAAPLHCCVMNAKTRHTLDDSRHWRGLDYFAAIRIAARLNKWRGVI